MTRHYLSVRTLSFCEVFLTFFYNIYILLIISIWEIICCMCLKDEAPCEIWTHVYWVETSNANHYTNGANKRCWTKTFQIDFKFSLLLTLESLIWRGSLIPWIISLYLRSKLSLVRHTRNDFSRSAENHSWNRVTKSIMEKRVLVS